MKPSHLDNAPIPADIVEDMRSFPEPDDSEMEYLNPLRDDVMQALRRARAMAIVQATGDLACEVAVDADGHIDRWAGEAIADLPAAAAGPVKLMAGQRQFSLSFETDLASGDVFVIATETHRPSDASPALAELLDPQHAPLSPQDATPDGARRFRLRLTAGHSLRWIADSEAVLSVRLVPA